MMLPATSVYTSMLLQYRVLAFKRWAGDGISDSPSPAITSDVGLMRKVPSLVHLPEGHLLCKPIGMSFAQADQTLSPPHTHEKQWDHNVTPAALINSSGNRIQVPGTHK